MVEWRRFYNQYLHPDLLLTYSTPKVVEIRNWKLGLLHYSIVLLLLIYTIVYAIILQHGYQGTSEVVGSATGRVDGSAFQTINGSTRVWDEHDIVYPDLEQNAIFITTNAIVYPGQRQGIWPASQYPCHGNSECPTSLSTSLGILTGTCDQVTEACLMHGWGPIPPVTAPSADTVLDGVQDFAVYIPCAVYFPAFGKKADNVDSTHQDEGVNYFSISTILSNLDVTYDEVAESGALIVAQLNWDCEFDWWSGPCKVDWSFRRIDNVSDDEDGATGFQVQRQDYYRVASTEDPADGDSLRRDSYYLAGLRFIFLIDGVGRRFDIVPTIVTFGSGIALITIGSIVSEFCALHLFPSRQAYNRAKYVRVRKARYGNYSESDSDVFTDSDDDMIDEKGKIRTPAVRMDVESSPLLSS